MGKMELRCPGGIQTCCGPMKTGHSVLCTSTVNMAQMATRYGVQHFLSTSSETNMNVKTLDSDLENSHVSSCSKMD
jgi:hypothetical protein